MPKNLDRIRELLLELEPLILEAAGLPEPGFADTEPICFPLNHGRYAYLINDTDEGMYLSFSDGRQELAGTKEATVA